MKNCVMCNKEFKLKALHVDFCNLECLKNYSDGQLKGFLLNNQIDKSDNNE